jgi:phosphoribosylaminoimidazole-succinocarboxamide synthase
LSTRNDAVMETHLDLPLYARGKVRDTYELDGQRLLMVATDRLSAFDVVLPTGIPDRGRVLTQLSAFWFRRTTPIQENHLLGLDHPDLPANLAGRAMVVRRCRRIDFECVVRGYLAGSAWAEYRASGTVAGERLPAGLQESQRLPEPLFTPATKAESGHDQNISFEQLRDRVGAELADRLRERSLALYREAAAYAEGRGLILADTKFEFGLVDDRVVLIDEALTPDSSRYWDASAYQAGRSPESYDKQFVRDWLVASGWDRSSTPPPLPAEVVAQTRRRYLDAYRLLTGEELA